MDVLNSHCAGLDVHKTSVFACRIYVKEGGEVTREVRKFGTFTGELLQLSDWLKTVGVTHVAMESTGEYWKPIYNVLEGQFELVVVNAQHLKAVPGRKSDVKDAEWIAQLLRHGLVKGSFVPSQTQRDLRELTRLRTTVVEDRARTVNRLQKVLEQANIKLASVVSDVTGVSAQAMLRELAAGNGDAIALSRLAQGQLRDKLPELEQALTGRVRPIHQFMLADALAQLDSYEARLARIEQEIDRYMHPFEAVIERLDTIPGVGRTTAQVIVAEVGWQVESFASAQQLCAWAGVAPNNQISAGKVLNAKTRKGNRALKVALTQAAQSATRKTRSGETYLKVQYHRLAARRGRKRAVMAVAHTILKIAYYLIQRGTVYEDLGADFFDQRDHERLTRRLTHRLERLGYAVSLTLQPHVA
jgi:transposase